MSAALNRLAGLNKIANLKANAEHAPTAAHRIPLVLIDEDPDQPRKHFDDAALRTLADSIAMPDTGLLQPITVRPVDGGRYVVCYGARRLRAVRMLGWADIPAIVRDDKAGIAGQVIENRQRQDNTDSELADAIATLTAQKRSNAEIATILALTDPQSVRYYRALAEVRLIPELAEWIDKAPARALYEAHAAWAKAEQGQRDAIAAMLAECQDLTVTAARRIIAAAKVPDPAAEMPAVSGVSQAEPTVQSECAGSAGQQPDTAPVHAADTIAPKPVAAALRPARHRPAAPSGSPSPLPEDERERRVRAWLDSPQRPRPSLTV